MFLVGGDFEDIELVVPTMEMIYRGAEVIIGKFPPELKARPPLLGLDVILGNFGVSIPFQEIPDSYYSIKNLEDLKMSDFDVVVITGAFNPWNVVATGTSEWLKEPYTAGKIIAAICHGPIPIAVADLVQGKKLTGWLASKDSVEIMGGEFNPDEWAAIIDGQLVTGRTPPEIPEFLDAISVALLD
jgi:protease I